MLNRFDDDDHAYRKAVRYSTSPIGGSTPPVHAMFTLKPTPAPDPTWGEGWEGGVITESVRDVCVPAGHRYVKHGTNAKKEKKKQMHGLKRLVVSRGLRSGV